MRPASQDDSALFVDSDGDPRTATDEDQTTDPERETWDGNQEFVVNRIVAEKEIRREDTGETVKRYLTLWRDWKEADATWEPSENFECPETIERWQLRKQEEDAGRKKPYDLLRFDRLQRQRRERKARASYRARQPRVVADSDESDVSDIEPLVKKRKINPSGKRPINTDSDDSSGRESGSKRLKTKSSRPARQPIRRFDDFDDDENEASEPAFDPITTLARKANSKQPQRPVPNYKDTLGRKTTEVPIPETGPAARKITRMITQPNRSAATPAAASASLKPAASRMFRSLGQQNRVNKARGSYEAPPQPGGVNLLATRTAPSQQASTADLLSTFDTSMNVPPGTRSERPQAHRLHAEMDGLHSTSGPSKIERHTPTPVPTTTVASPAKPRVESHASTPISKPTYQATNPSTHEPVIPPNKAASKHPLPDSGVVHVAVDFVDHAVGRTSRRNCKLHCFVGQAAASAILKPSQAINFSSLCSFWDVQFLVGAAPPAIARGVICVSESESGQVLQDLSTSVRTDRAVCIINDTYCLLLADRQDPLLGPEPPAFSQLPLACMAFEIIRLDPSLAIPPRSLIHAGPLTGTSFDPLPNKVCSRLLPIFDSAVAGQKGAATAKKVALLIYPSEQVAPDRVLVQTWLEQRVNAIVINLDEVHPWKSLIDQKAPAPVVLYHPTMRDYGAMPGIREGLQRGEIQHFEVHHDDTGCYQPIRLFPQGEVVLLADHVIKYRPQDVLACIETLKKRLENGRQTVLVVRPQHKEFMWECMSAALESASVKQAKAYTRISETIAEISLSWPAAFVELPNIKARAHADAWKRDQGVAARSLVAAFAAWIYEQRTRLRRFVVLYSPPPGTGLAHRDAVNAVDTETYITTPDSERSDPVDDLRKEWNARFAHLTTIDPAEYLKTNEMYHKAGQTKGT